MISSFRKEIDEIDSQLVKLISKRIKIAKKLGEYKKKNGIAITDKNREKELINHRTRLFLANGIQDKTFAKQFFSLLISKSKEVQK